MWFTCFYQWDELPETANKLFSQAEHQSVFFSRIWFVVHGKSIVFKLAYDEAWKKHSPGSILTEYFMQAVIDVDKVTEIDYLTGNDHYKKDWMSERRRRWNLVCTRKPTIDNEQNKLIKLLQKLKKVIR